jgi:hypothetical protein
MVRCGICGVPLEEPTDVPANARRPCRSCGSTTHLVEAAATLSARATITAAGAVERGLNDVRLGVLGFIVAIGTGAASVASPAGWEVALPVGVVAFAATCGAVRWRRSRHLLMEFAYRLTGR